MRKKVRRRMSRKRIARKRARNKAIRRRMKRWTARKETKEKETKVVPLVPDKDLKKKKRPKELSDLIALGKEKGHLTFEEVNNLLPDDIVSSEEIDEILSILGAENIRLVDSEEEAVKERPEEEPQEEKAAAKEEKVEAVRVSQVDD